MSDIKILVAMHKEAGVLKNPLLLPIQVGSALAERRLPDMLHDDEGIHISGKNKSYCEMTAQYWAWKNLRADYYGFFHYRRYMSFASVYPAGRKGNPKAGCCRPYQEADSLDGCRSKYALEECRMRSVIERYDVITVLGERMDVTVYEQFCQFHKKEDLDRAVAILKRHHPRQRKACDDYMNSKSIYFCNMYIMRREYFESYMQWLFPVLEEFEAGRDFAGCSGSEMRIAGYLAERLFGVYYTWLKHEGQAKCAELQYVIFHRNIRQFRIGKKGLTIKIDMRKVNRILPAGSCRRRLVRRMMRKGLQMDVRLQAVLRPDQANGGSDMRSFGSDWANGSSDMRSCQKGNEQFGLSEFKKAGLPGPSEEVPPKNERSAAKRSAAKRSAAQRSAAKRISAARTARGRGTALKTEPLVSVVMLTYNHRPYIRQALESVLAQVTSFPFEVLVGDDASVDGTSEIVREYAQRYPNQVVGVVRPHNLGATRNLGDLFSRCRGRYIAGCEGDDYWTDADKLEKQVRFLKCHPEYIACSHEIEIVDKRGVLLPDQGLGWICRGREYSFSCFGGIKLPGHPAALVFRNVFQEGVSPHIVEKIDPMIADRTIAVMLSARGRIYRLPDRMAAYRRCMDPNDRNVTAQIYTGGGGCLRDYRINERLECYASSVLGHKVVFRRFRWKIVAKATLKAVLRPSLGTGKYLTALYQYHIHWLVHKRSTYI